MLDTYTDPPILRITEYFCLECGGLTKLPDQLILDPRVLRWCICLWPQLQKDFIAAYEYYEGQEEEQQQQQQQNRGLYAVEQPKQRDTA